MITSPANERVKYVRSLYQGPSRRRERAFVIEGVRLVEEALRAGVAPTLVLVDEGALERTPRGRELLGQLRPYRPLRVSEAVLKTAAGTVTPQGIVAVVPIPPSAGIDPAGPLVVVLDDLSDPGNVGTVLRTAWASGVVPAVISLGGVDPYSPKVVRAASGAHFHLQLLDAGEWEPLRRQLVGRRLLVAVSAVGTPYYQVCWEQPSALVIGSEAHGVRPEIVAAADELVLIPMPGRAESINAAVAAGILIFEAARHLVA